MKITNLAAEFWLILLWACPAVSDLGRRGTFKPATLRGGAKADINVELEHREETEPGSLPSPPQQTQSQHVRPVDPPSTGGTPDEASPSTFPSQRKATLSQQQLFRRAAEQASKTWKHYTGGRDDQGGKDEPHRYHDDDQTNINPLSLLQTISSSVLQRFPVWLWTEVLMHTAQNGGGPTLAGMYAVALLGASCGFSLFLYFISLGYAAGIGIPLALALTHFVRSTTSDTNTSLLDLVRSPKHMLTTSHGRTMSHTALVILWSMRMLAFLVWREYFNWPALHKRIVQVNQRRPQSENPQQKQEEPPGFLVKTFCWIVYSFFYMCMLSPCFFRMRHELGVDATQQQQQLAPVWAQVSDHVALVLQSLGLLLETVADSQKLAFKAQPNCRYQWCGAVPGLSLWKWSTHPNYLGEGLFWFGTSFGGFVSLAQHFDLFSENSLFSSPPSRMHKFLWQTGFMLTGFGFIFRVLQGAVQALDLKQNQTYGQSVAYVSFRQTHGFWGRKWWKRWEEIVLEETTTALSTNVEKVTPEKPESQHRKNQSRGNNRN